MAKYVLIVDAPALPQDKLELLASHFDDFIRAADNAYIIRSSSTTTKEVSDLVFPRSEDEPVPRHIVLRFTSYWGNHNRDLWEWMDSGGDDD